MSPELGNPVAPRVTPTIIGSRRVTKNLNNKAEHQSSMDKMVPSRDCQDDNAIEQRLGEHGAKMRAHHEPSDKLMYGTPLIQLSYEVHNTIAASDYLRASKPQCTAVKWHRTTRGGWTAPGAEGKGGD